MKDDYFLKFQPVKQGHEYDVAKYQKKGNIFFIGTYGDICLDLRLENYEVNAADTIKEGINCLKESVELPDVIIINKKIDLETTALIRSLKINERCGVVPIIYITDKFDPKERDLAIEIGIEDYYTEKIGAEYLVYRIEFLKRLKQLSNENTEEVEHKPKPSLHNDDALEMWSLKRTFDIIVSGIALLLISPLLLLIAIAIKIDSKGPVFYISKRAGTGYRIFNFYKFRSMRENADQILEELMDKNQYADNSKVDGAVFFKVKDDPRVTRLGTFLRNTSLDELPQLFNVLKGDMSLVGNRPLPLYEAEKLTQDQWALRFLAPAGITGLWQITKRGKEEMSEEERVALDMEYAQMNSFWYDLKIILKTPAALFQKEKV